MFSDISFDFHNDLIDNLTHSLHPYPAKFPPQLPRHLLKKFAVEGDTILDPFCGSGTTLLEARLQGVNAIGVDINQLSALLSIVKSTPLNKIQQNQIVDLINELENQKFLLQMNQKFFENETKDIEGKEHWFQHNVAIELTFILKLISQIHDIESQNFLKIILSSIIVRVSNQESDTRFSAIHKNISDFFTTDLFISKTYEGLKIIQKLNKQINTNTTLKVISADSRNLEMLQPNSIDMIITSPPYANTYDYYLYHKFRQRWLDLDVKHAQYNEIGSRREFSSLKKPVTKWYDDLKLCFIEMNRLLKSNKLACIVIGDSIIQKELIQIDNVIKNFSADIGFKIEKIMSSDLSKHSRLFNQAFAKKGKKEHLIIMRKI